MATQTRLLLRRGADVHATDGRFGTLSDIVVDPLEREITHVVVSPDGEHQLRRLVPLWLVNESDDGIRVELDRAHLSQLQRVLGSDFIRSDRPDLDSHHDIRFRTVLLHPYFADPVLDLDAVTIDRDQFDVRRGSDVVSSNDRLLGQVAGFLVRDRFVTSVVVRSGLVGFQENVAVPIGCISAVHPDMVELDIDRHEFRALESTSLLPHPGRDQGRMERVRHGIAGGLLSTRDRLREARTELWS